jgi:hypothetical protein
MAKNVVFLVHGMGKFLTPDAGLALPWHEAAVKMLDDAWSGFPALQALNRRDYIEYVPITYDHIFREYLSGIADAADRLQRYMPSAEMSDVVEVFQQVGQDQRAFFWENIMDVLDYRYGAERFRYVHAHIARVIAGKVTSVLAQPDRQNTSFSVISHSLGTAAVHGALNRLGGGNIGTSAAFRLGGAFRIRSYVTLANVSRVLWYGEHDIYHGTIVRPFTPSLGRGYVDQFINVQHAADPIVAPQPFAPSDWGNAYQSLTLHHVRQINLHDLTHYLQHPAVSGAIFRSLLGGDAFLTEDEVRAAVAEFPDVALTDPNRRAQIEQLIAALAITLKDTYGSDQSLLWSLPKLIASAIRDLIKHREALRALLEAV